MSFMVCCVPGCLIRYGEGVPLHCFPNPSKDLERFRMWVAKIGVGVAGLKDEYIFTNRRVCRRHFIPNYLYPKNRLCKLAVPSIRIPENTATESVGENLSVQHVQEFNLPYMPTAAWADVPTNQIQTSSPIVPFSSASTLPSGTENKKSAMYKKQTGRKMTTEEVAVRKEIKILKSKITRVVNSKNNFKKRLTLAKRSDLISSLHKLKMSEATKTFIAMQISQCRKKNTGRRFTLNQKILALSLYKPSPKAYRILSDICILPKRKTLQRLLQKVKLTTGLNPILIENLKNKVQKIPSSHRYCTLIFDEMAISTGLKYDKKQDEIIGFNDDGENKSKIFCDHALVFMIRGVIKKFKQPILYSFCSGTTKTIDLKNLIIKIVTMLQECGLIVVATICDQGATNVAAVNSLLKDTIADYLRRQREMKGMFFEIKGKKIYPLFDPPHMMKGIRNNLISKNLKYNKENRNCVANWNHIQELYKRSPGYKGVRLVPKLTASHVMPNLIPKMKVKHCTQVFSHSVGVALGFMADAGILPEEYKETADLLIFFDNLFDSVNGSFSTIQGGKIYRSAVTPKSPHQKLWLQAIPILKSMKFVDNNGKETVVPSLSSWVKTIENFKDLVKDLHSKGLNSLLLRHFNQDPIENFFGAIRSHGHANIMPNAAAFQDAYKTLLINNISSPHSVGANCEVDKTNTLQNLNFFFTSQKEVVLQIPQIEIQEEHIHIKFVEFEELIKSKNRNDIERCAALGYCSGWIVKMAKSKIYKNCGVCIKVLESAGDHDFHQFIKIKEYCNKNWLLYPSKDIFDVFYKIEILTMEILRSRAEKPVLLEYISLIVSIHIDFTFLKCEHHKRNLSNFFTNKCILFFIHNWCKEINTILHKKNENYDNTDPFKVAASNYADKKWVKRKQ